MATITVPVLAITNVNDTTVRLSVSYTLTPTLIEKQAGSVFSETIKLFADDPALDLVISNFPTQSFAVNANTVNVARTRTRNELKGTLNEDAGFEVTGAEQVDEVYAQVTVIYAANPPVVPTPPAPRKSNIVTGAWHT